MKKLTMDEMLHVYGGGDEERRPAPTGPIRLLGCTPHDYAIGMPVPAVL